MKTFWAFVFRLTCWFRGLDPYQHLINLKVKRDGFITPSEHKEILRMVGPK